MKNLKRLIAYLIILSISATSHSMDVSPKSSHAGREETIRALFSGAEEEYPNLFAPSSALIQKHSPWTYVYYSSTNTYIGVNDEDQVWVLGDVFGGKKYIDTLNKIHLPSNTGDSRSDLVPLIPHPRIPDAFLVKQKTEWVAGAVGLYTGVVYSLTLNPDGTGTKYFFSEDTKGVLDSDLHQDVVLGSHLIVYELIDDIEYHIEIVENEERVVYNETGVYKYRYFDDTLPNEAFSIIHDASTNVPGPQIVAPLLDDRKNIVLKHNVTITLEQ